MLKDTMEIISFVTSFFVAVLLAIPVYAFTKPVFFGAPFAATTRETIRTLIRTLKAQNTLGSRRLRAVDLGSGDGRIVIALAQEGFEAHGFELNPFLVTYSRWRIRSLGLEKNAFIHYKNYWAEDLSRFDVVTVFGISYIMKKLGKKLKAELKPESLIASNYFTFPNSTPVLKERNVLMYKAGEGF